MLPGKIMPLKVNIRMLQRESAQLEGTLAVEEVAGELQDELVRFVSPLSYDLEVAMQGGDLRVLGKLQAELECDCSRCLKTFRQTLLIPDFAALLATEGEEAVKLDGDFADLTPYLREDTFLALPTTPLCTPDCRGLAAKASARDSLPEEETKTGSEPVRNPWKALDKLKL
jgi:uncharacterized protein